MANRNKKRSPFRALLRIFLYLLLASLAYVGLCKWIFPPITITQLGSLFQGYGLDRHYVAWEKISPNVKLAALASEDQLFPDHGGFDWKALEKSIEQPTRKSQKRSKGAAASTISQQTAKNVFLWQGTGWGRYIRKAPEAFYTKMIELVWGKKRILEVYLNVIETGPGVFGIEAAARKYFHKSAEVLTRQEAAMIIAGLPNPKKFTVVPLSRRVKWRAPQIVRQMGYMQSDPDVRALLN